MDLQSHWRKSVDTTYMHLVPHYPFSGYFYTFLLKFVVVFLFAVWLNPFACGFIYGSYEHRHLPDPAQCQPWHTNCAGRNFSSSGGSGKPDRHHSHSSQKWSYSWCSCKSKLADCICIDVCVCIFCLQSIHFWALGMVVVVVVIFLFA